MEWPSQAISPDWSREDVALRALFDQEYYLTCNPDIEKSGQDPFEHYMTVGWRQLRNPSESFNTKDYLALHPDVATAGINPFYHFAVAGAAEGRATLTPPGNANKAIVLGAQSPRIRGRHYAPARDVVSPLGYSDIADKVNAVFCQSVRVVIAASHDEYFVSSGGVQNCIADEAAYLTNAGWGYIHLCPARPLPMLADEDIDHPFSMVMTINGQREGVVLLPDLLWALAEHAPERYSPLFVAHHMMGFSTGAIRALAEACGPERPIFWVHDFFSLCPNPFLLRNDLVFCGAPPANSGSCLVCCYGSERQNHLARIDDLFRQLQPLVIAPSTTALEFWRSRANLVHLGSEVIPLARLNDNNLPIKGRGADSALRVAHLGAAATHKGWETFRALVERHAGDTRYEFFRLGTGHTGLPGLTEVPVLVTPQSRSAMIDAIRDHAIDVVINWSNCFETFSFTAIEAVAGGAYVLARREAGNVWPAVASAGDDRGRPVGSDMELRALFITGEIAKLAQASRPYGDLLLGNGTADFVINRPSNV